MVTYVLEAHLCAWSDFSFAIKQTGNAPAETDRAQPLVSSVQTLVEPGCSIRRLCFSHHAECRVLPALQAQGTLAALAFPA